MGYQDRYTGLFDPEYDTGQYSHRDSLSFAVASSLAYASKNKTEQVAGQLGFSKVLPFEEKRGGDIDTQGFIAADGSHLIVSFRGSEPKLADWLANIQTVTDPGPFPKSDVHEGFQDALFPVVLRVAYMLREYRNANQQVWVTGHSLGGALASLFAALLVEEKLPFAGLYTFASPRVGNKAFEKAMNSRAKAQGAVYYRVVNEGDAVPHVPPEPWFSHAGVRVLLTDGQVLVGEGATKKESKTGWKKFRQDLADFFMETVNPLHVAKVHLLDGRKGYIAALEKAVD